MDMRAVSQLLAFAGFLGLAIQPEAEAATATAAIGKVMQVERKVEATYIDVPRPLRTSSPMFFNDTVKTHANARFKATLDDGTELTLGENARLKIDDFVYDPSGAEGELSVRVLAGAFLFVGGQVESIPGNRVKIQTPVGTLGIRGTTVWGGRIDDGYGVLVLDGEVDVTTAGGTVKLRAGEATMIKNRNAKPMAPHQWSEEKIGRAVETISFQEN